MFLEDLKEARDMSSSWGLIDLPERNVAISDFG